MGWDKESVGPVGSGVFGFWKPPGEGLFKVFLWWEIPSGTQAGGNPGAVGSGRL